MNMQAATNRDSDLYLTQQKHSTNLLDDRKTGQYKKECITEFADKWDTLIDWDARAASEGNFIIDVLRARDTNTVFDVATGTGFHSVRLLEAGFDVTSADGSAAMLARAFDNGKERGHILKTVLADWRWLGQSTRERFDALVCMGNSFTHLHDELDRRRVLAEFYAALEPNGVLIIDQRNYDCMVDQVCKSKHKLNFCGNNVNAAPLSIDKDLVNFQYFFADGSDYALNLHPLRKDYLRQLLREAGFERIRTYGDFKSTYEPNDPDFFIHVAEKSSVSKMVPVGIDLSSRGRAVVEDYYNSDDADAFYSRIWGGDDLHLGIYSETKDIRAACQQTVDSMADCLPSLDEHTKVIDLGSGYGGSGRRLARKHGCNVVALNLSKTQNDRNRLKTTREGLLDKIDIVHGDFEDIPAPNDSFDVVWSQDSFLHSENRDRIVAEAFRVLKPGGHFVFTDPMERESCPKKKLSAIYRRLNLSSLGSFSQYREYARLAGFQEIKVVDLSPHLARHYGFVLERLLERRAEVEEAASEHYVSNLIQGLKHWVTGGENGSLTWGILHFQKPL